MKILCNDNQYMNSSDKVATPNELEQSEGIVECDVKPGQKKICKRNRKTKHPQPKQKALKKRDSFSTTTHSYNRSNLPSETRTNASNPAQDQPNQPASSDVLNQYIPELESTLLNSQKHYLPNLTSSSSSSRKQLVDWIFLVCERFRFKIDTGFLAVNILDRFMGLMQVPFEELYLLTITVLFIAVKYEEILIPKIMDFVLLGKGNSTISKQSILNMESVIICVLQFDLGYVSPAHFLELISYKLNLAEGERKSVIKTAQNLMNDSISREKLSSQIALEAFNICFPHSFISEEIFQSSQMK